MLSPNTRSLYTAALTPPPGFNFDEAIGTTYSLDPAVLLTVPLHLALLGGQQRGIPRDGIAVLEAVRRLSSRITVYAQCGCLLVPSPPNPLYGLLEAMTVEVLAPQGGVFHPKLWVLRFVEPAGGTVLLRLLVLSRNLTQDRSWDVALTLEGTPTGRSRSGNRELSDLVRALPTLAARKDLRPVEPARVEQAQRLSEELRRADWDLPLGYDEVSFSVLGFRRGRWTPPRSKRAAILSPFCSDAALEHLFKETSIAALVSRPETLQALAAETRSTAARCLTLADAAESEDGEDTTAAEQDTLGLHAKVYVFEQAWNTHVVLGSANATSSAILGGQNVEILAELIGKRSQVGGIDELLGDDGLGEVLVEAPSATEPLEVDPAQLAAEAALEAARGALVRAVLRITCNPGANDSWRLQLEGLCPPCAGIAKARAWPITVPDGLAVDLWSDKNGHPVVFPDLAAASITGLIAFELVAQNHDLSLRFVLNLPVEGMPEARDSSIIQTVVRNQEGFLRYLLLLLGDLGSPGDMTDNGSGGFLGSWTNGTPAGAPVLEDLVRAYSRAPERLREVSRVVERFVRTPSGAEVVPPEFLELWRVFERALERRRE